MAKGETVKYIIDADTSGFSRGMAEAAISSDVAGKTINRNLNGTSKKSENNFKDMRKGAQVAAMSIRNFGTALQGFNTTSIIIGVTALTGSILELAGAFSAAGSTLTILAPMLLQGVAAMTTFKTGVSGLGAAWKAIGANDGGAFLQSMRNLGPAAKQTALALGGLNKAFNSVRRNTQNALLAGIGPELLRLGATLLPTINAGMQRVAQAMNNVFHQATGLSTTPLFNGLLATIFADTARTINVLSGALAPILSIFTNLYLITRPYVTLLAQQFVNLTKNLAAYLGSVRGQTALTIAIQQGLIAIKELGRFVGAVFGLLVSVFRTSVNAGNALIPTLTAIINRMTDWVNSAKGQQDLISLFNFTSLAVQAVANSVGRTLNIFFSLVNIIANLNPVLQTMIVNFLASSLTLRPLVSYLAQLWLAIRTLAVAIFNFGEQLIVVFTVLGAAASIVLIVGAALMVLGAIIRGPLGSALLVVGAALLIYVGLNYLLTQAANMAAGSMVREGYAAIAMAGMEAEAAFVTNIAAMQLLGLADAAAAGEAGMSMAARGAMLLQSALIPLLVLAAGVLLILGMLGVFSSKTKTAKTATTGLGGSLGALQKSMAGMGGAGDKASNGGLANLSDSLNNVGDAAAGAQGQLASFDKMNVLTPATGPGSGIPGLPSLPNVGSAALGAPTLDTGAFDKAIADMQNNLGGLQNQLKTPFSNPFDAIGKWIDKHPWIGLAIFTGIIIAIAAAFILLDVATLPISVTLGLIVLAVIAVIAIAILLWKNWDTIWAGMKNIVNVAWQFIQSAWDGILNGAKTAFSAVGDFFSTIFNGIVGFIKTWGITILAVMFLPFSLLLGLIFIFKDQIGAFFTAIWNFIVSVFTPIGAFFGSVFSIAWQGIQTAFGAALGFFSGIWNGIMTFFAPAIGFFAGIFSGAWDAIKVAFGAVGGFFQGVWNSIVNIFGAVGTAIGNAIGGAFKSVVNTVINTVSGIVNDVINLINGAIGLINHIPGVHIGTIGRLTLPRLAKGGVVTSPTFAQIGEAGAEAVMPLENNTGWIDMLAAKINSSNGNTGGQPIHLTVQIGEDKVANKIIDLINEKTQMSGRNTILV